MRTTSLSILLTILLLHIGIGKACCATNDNEKITISGTVVDEDNKPIIGSAVYLKSGSHTVGCVSDFDGKFALSVVPEGGTFGVTVSYVGYKTLTHSFYVQALTDNKGTIKVRLLEDKRKNKNKKSSVIAQDFSDDAILKSMGFINAAKQGIAKANEQKKMQAQEKTPQQLYDEGCDYYNGTNGKPKDLSKAFELFRQGALQGHAESQYWVGNMYYHGNGTMKNQKEAVAWYQKAAEQGHKSAQSILGSCYYFGYGVTKNYPSAFSWYEKAAEQGDATSMLNIGVMYENGDGVKKSNSQALAWYNKAAEQDNETAKKYAKSLVAKGVKPAKLATTSSSTYDFTFKNPTVPSSSTTITAASKSTAKASPSASPAKSTYEVAGEALNTNNYDKALQILQDAVKREDDVRLQNLLGLMYLDGKGVEVDYNKALEHIMIAASKGYPAAEYNLGHMYDNGLGVNKDERKAFEWYLKSAEQGLDKAQNAVAQCYEEGTGTEQDYQKAVEWYHKASDQKNQYAQFNLAILYSIGCGVPQDYKKAFELYEKAAINGYSSAEYKVAQCYENGQGVTKNEKKAFEWCLKAAEHNDKIAQNEVGWRYDTGTGTSKDAKKAAEWYLKSAEQGYYIAQYNIAYFYYQGIGVEKDNTKAFEWFMKSASQGYYPPEFFLGTMYWNGHGVKQDYQEAVMWLEKAADHNDTNAQQSLAWIYYEGTNVPQNIKRAIALMEKAAQSGNAQAQCDAGYFLLEDTPEKDYNKAFVWTQKAANQGHSIGINNLGWCYEHGYGVSTNLFTAVEYYKKAADQDAPSGLNNLGRMYENGYGGLPVDYSKAMELYLKAADKNSYKAMRNIAKMYEKGLGVEKNLAQAVIWYSKADEGGDKEAKSRLAEFNQRLSGMPVAASSNASVLQPQATISQNNIPLLPETPKRIALIIGNDDYGTQRLDNPVKDAMALNAVLQLLGFETNAYMNLDKEETERLVAEFTEKASNYDMALFYYAGHAIQSKGVNYLVPARPEPVLNHADVKRKYVDLPFIVNSMIDAEAKRNIIILDACRDTPDFIGVKTRGGKNGLAYITEPEKFLVAYSTQAGMTAADGKGMEHSPFMTVLLEQLKVPGLNVDQLFVRVRDNVQEMTHNEQRPFFKNNLSELPSEKFYFNRGK